MENDEAPPLGYAGLRIDRAAERRDDAAFVAAAARDPAARTLLFVDDRPALTERPGGAVDPLFGLGEPPAGRAGPAAFLGVKDGAPMFAGLLSESWDDDAPQTGDLRALGSDGRLSGDLLALTGYGKSMAAWHARHGFCSNCGAATQPNASGWRRSCPSCGALHFPRVDPVVIMLVTRRDHCLLGRQSRFPPGMWSCLAGFVEPGETVEEAAAREISEEAGLEIGAVAYELSQPWPFPSQLMIGVSAEALSDEITPDAQELEDARWFSRDDVARMLVKDHPEGWFAPPSAAIAHHLLRRFVTR